MKKYNKAKVIDINQNSYNEELDYLHHELLSFALHRFDHIFMEQIHLYSQFFSLENNELDADYFDGVTFWMILNLPIDGQGQTIFDVFYQEEVMQIKHPRTKGIFASWQSQFPSIYEVISLDNEREKATLKNIWTKEWYIVSYTKDDNLQVGQCVTGTLLPFLGHHRFLFTNITINLNNEVSALIGESRDSNYLIEHYPIFLALLLQLDSSQLKWKHPLHEKAARLFANHMISTEGDPETIAIGIKTWFDYCEKNTPLIKNYTSYAATIQYFVMHYILGKSDVTQKDIANKYGTTASTISTNYRKIVQSFEADRQSYFYANDDLLALEDFYLID